MRLKLISAAAVSAASLLAAGAAFAQPGGEALFKENCAACHQPDGKGVPGAFPALAGNTFVQGPAKDVAGTVLNGRGGMPSFRSELSRGQIAQILTYVRSAWGNAAPAIDEATVLAAPGGDKDAPAEEAVLGFH
jgi:mono/diheme cytochrome c family protein